MVDHEEIRRHLEQTVDDPVVRPIERQLIARRNQEYHRNSMTPTDRRDLAQPGSSFAGLALNGGLVRLW